MGLFSKKQKQEEKSEETDSAVLAENSKAEATEEEENSPSATTDDSQSNSQPKSLPEGPLDFSQITAEQMSDYADFGVFLVPKMPGLAVHPESPLDEKSFGFLTLQYGKAAVELLAVAAPKSKRLWGDLRADIRGETTKQGNTCEERVGSFGKELLVQMAVQAPNGQRGHIQVRYCGVDGPNWFVRLVFNGVVTPDDPDLVTLEAVVKTLVVVRGDKPMTPRSIIPVVLPDELASQLSQLQNA